MKLRFILPLVAMLGGCATPTLYQWGGYDQLLYTGYKDSSKMEAMRVSLEEHIAAVEQSRQRVAPGLYAELGTLYLQLGQTDRAIANYKRERAQWPESAGLMTAMIQNLERREKDKSANEREAATSPALAGVSAASPSHEHTEARQ